jgi:hypothetical protein
VSLKITGIHRVSTPTRNLIIKRNRTISRIFYISITSIPFDTVITELVNRDCFIICLLYQEINTKPYLHVLKSICFWLAHLCSCLLTYINARPVAMCYGRKQSESGLLSSLFIISASMSRK